MKITDTITPEAQLLIEAVCNGIADDAQLRDLESLLLTDEKARRSYAYLLELDANLQWLVGSQYAGGAALAKFIAAKETPSVSPAPTFPATLLHSMVGYFSSGWPVAYLVATVILGIGLTIGAFTYVSQPGQVATTYPAPVIPCTRSEAGSVGRITGMDACQWANAQATPTTDVVCLGNKYALTSGMMEITYDTGAKVILQGPVTYEVESKNGGFLPIGKLTGTVEAEKAKGFSIRTPTATVTDLGTEFGVEVDRRGCTTSHVFRGSVRLQPLGGGTKQEHKALVLRTNESGRAEKVHDDNGSSISLRRVVADPQRFARRIVQQAKFIDLLDIVAGGNGAGHCRERGVDPASCMEDPAFLTSLIRGDGKYHRHTTFQLIDGTFVFGGNRGPVQLDSAGDAFDGFPSTIGQTWGSIWARAATVRPRNRGLGGGYYWLYCLRPEVEKEFMPENRGLLGLHANVGITFDLEAIRQRHGGRHISRFHAVSGKEKETLAEIWVFVDGRLKLRSTLKPTQAKWSGAVPIDIVLKPTDHFLTLASTDGGDGIDYDWVVFGDPVLQLAPEGKGREGGL
jgi:hypothetical protein